MHIIYNIEEYKNNQPVCLALGAFDGIHLGHLELIKQTVKNAKINKIKSLLLTFKPHPRSVIFKNKNFKLITSYEEKEEIISKLGIDIMLVLNFNEQLFKMSAEEFINEIILKHINVKEIFVGFNFNFGNNRLGNTELLNKLGTQLGFKVNIIEPVKIDTFIISSSKIRLLIEAGAIEEVIAFLGRPFSIIGKVVKGDGLGQKLNVPTANICLKYDYTITPKPGVYIVKCNVKNKFYNGIINIGVRPTVYEKKSDKIIFELHILNFNNNIYNEEIKIYFLKRLRDEKKFLNFIELYEQIKYDINVTNEYFLENDEKIKKYLIFEELR